MFWGLIMEPKRRYTQVVKKAFHISMASLDITSGNNEPTQVLLTYDGRNYLLCTLQKEKDIQVPLDLNFEEGDEVSFATNGSCHVHLTGYLITDEDEVDEEEDEEEDQKETMINSPENVLKKSLEKKKRKSSGDSSPNDSPKKSKTAQLLEAVNSDSDDSDDMNFSDILKEEGLEEEESGDDEENEEESSDEIAAEGSEDDEKGEDGAEEESSLSDDAFEPEKPKVNGVTPKKKEKKQNQEKTPKQNQQKTPKKELGKTPKEAKSAQKEKKTEKGEKTPSKEQSMPQAKKKILEGGVQVQDLVVGNGQLAKPGKLVQVYYEGRLKNNNKVFDSAKQGSGFKFRLGSQEVIKGWDVGIQGMKVGGKRRIVCPPNMAYGQKGSPPVIPSNSTLIFEVELKNVH
ncbi:46 kDa FK506-binding nuclear protein [Agrilus planipennis]|uniref:FK506-binding protein n=1 Tax=Agrilus planipennis TaxID=224129 RepID=A0A1W4XHH5_AGRPL|nr:46 kDa FK506-binding nuclear protein [Agrilus planipennis]